MDSTSNWMCHGPALAGSLSPRGQRPLQLDGDLEIRYVALKKGQLLMVTLTIDSRYITYKP